MENDENDDGDDEMRMKMRISIWRMMRMMMGMMR